MAEEVKRDSLGRFLPGHGMQPPIRGPKYGRQLGRALREQYSPERVIEMVEEAWRMAVSRQSPKAAAELLELILSYTAGKPAQRVELANDATDVLAMLLADSRPLLVRPAQAGQLTDGGDGAGGLAVVDSGGFVADEGGDGEGGEDWGG